MLFIMKTCYVDSYVDFDAMWRLYLVTFITKSNSTCITVGIEECKNRFL